MLGSSLKITLRKLYREKVYALINIAGLSLGIACTVILSLYLRSEFTYDQHWEKHDRIYRVVGEFNTNGTIERMARTSQALGEMLKNDFPEVINFARLRYLNIRTLIHYEDLHYYWETVGVADNSLFEIFDHDILYGDPANALTVPNTVAVSEKFARQYFGDENPIGKTIMSDRYVPFTITLVYADLPENSHITYDVVFTYTRPDLLLPDNLTARRQMLWNVSDFTFLLMPEGYDPDFFQQDIQAFYDRHMSAMGDSLNATWTAWLQPLADMHYDTSFQFDEPTGNITYVYGFTAVAVFILLVACINYMNLATARATRRAREIGMQKILGADRGKLVLQFLAEAIFFALVSLVIAMGLVELVLSIPAVSQLLDKHLALDFSSEPTLAWWLLGFALVIGLLSGLYPALYLSSVVPLSALAGSTRSSKANVRIRELLVLLQFTISVGVIASTLLMAAQMRYISNKALGFDKENILIVQVRGVDTIETIPTIKTELSKHANILNIAATGSVPGQGAGLALGEVDNNDGVLERTTINVMRTEGNYFKVMDMQLIEGRDYSSRLLTDVGNTFVVNETFVRTMGWEQPLGKRIQLGNESGKVIGVVRDFHYESLHSEVTPLAMFPLNTDFDGVPDEFRPFQTRLVVIKVAGEGLRETLNYIQDVFAEFDPTHPFEFEFLDESLDELYLSETRLMQLTGTFAGICILIACLGLFGLAAFTTEQRTREIGIRKVLGSTSMQIITLLARNILLLVLSGSVIASLLSWYFMQEWFNGFAYRISINPLTFVLATLFAALVAYLTLALQSFRTAQSNPVNALRHE